MVHRMRLVDFAFKSIKNKEKDIELRLINIGDIIEFEHIDTKEVIKTQVIALHKSKSFDEIFNKFDHKRLGLKDSDDSSIMNNFYTIEEQEQYGALGIEIKLIEE